jgi:hypothetical protein
MGEVTTTGRLSLTAMICLCILLGTTQGYPGDFSRDGVIAKAARYANLTWFCTKQNARKDYNLLTPGKQYRGVPYNFGGFDSTNKFVEKVKKGVVAGNYRKMCGNKICVRKNFAGLDCSGLVSQSWEIDRYTTKTLPAITIKVPRKHLKPGDILNAEDKHVMLFDRFDNDNQIWVYESAAWVRIRNSPPAGVIYRAVDVGNDYVPRRYYKFIETGERIRTDKTIVALSQLNSKKRIYIPAGTTGTILKGPTMRGSIQKSRTPSDVWLYIKFSNGKEGWATIRHLTLIGEKA